MVNVNVMHSLVYNYHHNKIIIFPGIINITSNIYMITSICTIKVIYLLQVSSLIFLTFICVLIFIFKIICSKFNLVLIRPNK